MDWLLGDGKRRIPHTAWPILRSWPHPFPPKTVDLLLGHAHGGGGGGGDDDDDDDDLHATNPKIRCVFRPDDFSILSTSVYPEHAFCLYNQATTCTAPRKQAYQTPMGRVKKEKEEVTEDRV